MQHARSLRGVRRGEVALAQAQRKADVYDSRLTVHAVFASRFSPNARDTLASVRAQLLFPSD